MTISPPVVESIHQQPLHSPLKIGGPGTGMIVIAPWRAHAGGGCRPHAHACHSNPPHLPSHNCPIQLFLLLWYIFAEFQGIFRIGGLLYALLSNACFISLFVNRCREVICCEEELISSISKFLQNGFWNCSSRPRWCRDTYEVRFLFFSVINAHSYLLSAWNCDFPKYVGCLNEHFHQGASSENACIQVF